MVTLGADRDDHIGLLNSAIEQLLNHPRDTTIFAKDGKLEVNRLLLALHSPTAHCAIADCCSSSSISLPDFSIASVRVVIDLLTFGYTSIKCICSKDFENILAIAKLLQIKINHRNVQVFVEEAPLLSDSITKSEDTVTVLESNVEDKNSDNNIIEVDEKEVNHAVEEATYKDFSGSFYHKKFRLAGSKADEGKESVPVIDSKGERMASTTSKQRLSANLNTGEDQISAVVTTEVSNWVKRVNVQGDVANYFSPEQLQKVDDLEDIFIPMNSEVNGKEDLMAYESNIRKNKRKRQRNKRNGVQNKNSKKMRLEKMDVKANSDAEIDLPGTPVFMPIPDNLSDLDDNISETVLVIDFKESVDNMLSTSPKVEEIKKGNARYSEEQTSGLRKAFDENNFVSKEKAQILSKELCLTERQVRRWFQWYRAKTRVVANKPEDKFKVKVELLDETESHLEEMMEGDENLGLVEGRANSTRSPLKCEGVQGSISMYVTPKLKKQESLLDEDCNQEDEVSPRGEVKVKYDVTGISSIVDIKRKSQTNKLNDTTNAEFQKIKLDDALMIFEEEPSTMDTDIDELLITSDEEIDQSATPIPSKMNAKQIIAKRGSTRYSEQQIAGLRKAFDERNFISKEKAQELSEKLYLTEKQVKYWFINRRKTIAKQNRIMSKTPDYKPEDKVELAHIEEMVNHDKHLASASGRVKMYTCELCSKSFFNKSNFTEHLSSHNRAPFSNNENSNEKN